MTGSHKTLLFDLDGTLTDPKEGITSSIAHALVQMGRESPALDDLTWCIGPPLHLSFEKLLGDAKLVPEGMRLYRERFGTVGLFENFVYAEIPALLARLQSEGFILFLATSKPHFYARQILDHFKLTPFFRAVYGSELDGVRTNKGELIEYLLRQENISAEGCLMIGDREHDVLGAARNKIPCIGVLWGYGSETELRAAGARQLARTPDELYSLICDWT